MGKVKKLKKKLKKSKRELKQARLELQRIEKELIESESIGNDAAWYEERYADLRADYAELVSTVANASNEYYEIASVRHEDRKTTVTWADGSETSAVCSENDTYDPEIGFAICLAKKVAGGRNLKSLHREKSTCTYEDSCRCGYARSHALRY